MRRRPAALSAVLSRPRRLSFLLGAVALALSVLAIPTAASASTGLPLAAPVVTPSTTGPVAVGSPMTMTIAPGSATDHPLGYLWTWQFGATMPVYSAPPSCASGDQDGGYHLICGSSVSVRVSPEEQGFARFTVWALDARGNASPRATVDVDAIDDPAALYPLTHQWTTDQFGIVPPAARCATDRVTVDCVPDTAGVDSLHPNGAQPLQLPPGVTWDASGGGVSGVLTFGSGTRLPAATSDAVVDTRRSFAVGAWLTPSVSPSGTPATAVAEEGPGGTGFELGLTGSDQWQFRVHTASGDSVALAAGTAGYGYPVYLAGVADVINHELRLYFNGTAAAIVGFTPGKGRAPDGVATVGGRLEHGDLAEPWTGQVGNPVLAQAPLTNVDLARLAWANFFPGSDDGLN